MVFQIGSASPTSYNVAYINRMTNYYTASCAFTSSFSSTKSFLTFDSNTNNLSLATTDPCDIGDYSQPSDTFALTLIPSEIPQNRADEVYTFDVSITCMIYDV